MAETNLSYFAYGSNMEPDQMVQRLGRAIEPRGVGRLNGYRFGYWGHSILWALTGTADITPAEKSDDYVLGVIYNLVNDDLDKLDKYEHVLNGRYKRQLFDVSLEGETILAFAYVLSRDGKWKYPEDENEPSAKYVSQCATAARNMLIPQEYIDKYILRPKETK